MFQWLSVRVLMSTLDFDWNGDEPVPGVNACCFSLRWVFKAG